MAAAIRPISGGGLYIDEPGTGKKRKVPAFPIPMGRYDESDPTKSADLTNGSDPTQPIQTTLQHEHEHDDDEDQHNCVAHGGKFRPNYHIFSSAASKACTWKRGLFLRRKAALITLYLDAQNVIIEAQNAILEGKSKLSTQPKKLPDVSWFEKLIPALEDMGLNDWPMDRPGWRDGLDVPMEGEKYRGDIWRMGFERRKRARLGRKPVERKGLAPEGSFEFELESKASINLRTRTRNRINLAKLAHELRALIITHGKTVKPVVDHVSDDDLPSKTRRKYDAAQTRPLRTGHPDRALSEKPTNQLDTGSHKAAKAVNSDVTTSMPAATASIDGKPAIGGETKAAVAGDNMSKTNSSQGSEAATGKKKPKKKKRSVWSNQNNPHHVDNYRPGRVVAAAGDPYMPYPSHASLLFPPPMAFLAVRPKNKDGTPNPPIRASEEDFLCTFCEYALYYGSEALRKKAIRQRRKELLKKMEIKARAKNVAEGNGKGRLGKEEDEEEYSDEEDEGCEDDCQYGRCKCGRPLSTPHDGKEKKPPDRPIAPIPS